MATFRVAILFGLFGKTGLEPIICPGPGDPGCSPAGRGALPDSIESCSSRQKRLSGRNGPVFFFSRPWEDALSGVEQIGIFILHMCSRRALSADTGKPFTWVKFLLKFSGYFWILFVNSIDLAKIY